MNLLYDVKDKPKFAQLIVFALQQLLAIMAATLVVPIIVNASGAVNLEMDPSAALVGAGAGTIVYLLFTKFRSPVFLGSSFAFLSAMSTATTFGYFGIILGAISAGLVYVVIAILVKLVGVRWLSKLIPAVVIGPTVAIIGLSLAGNAISDLTKASATGETYNLFAILCGLITLFVTMLFSTFGKKFSKLIPFILGIVAGYCVASIFTTIGNAFGIDAMKIVNYSSITNCFSPLTLSSFFSVPKFAFVQAIGELSTFDWSGLGTILLLYMPVAFVVFAEHVADHNNLSTIINRNLMEDPGLSRTLLGDGVGSMAGALFGCCPNTTYGESIACVALTRNASVYTIITAAISAIVLAFFSPFVAFVNSIPSCVMGGVCMALYGFIAVSGLKMLSRVDLNENSNLYVVSVIMIAGIGGLTLNFGKLQITSIAAALILGIITNLLLTRRKKKSA